MNIRRLLLPLSPVYGLVMYIRNWMYDKNLLVRYQADVPIISVGNISTGGTGKTPVAEYLLEVCRDMGVRAAYLSRGYGRKSRGYLRVDPQIGDSYTFGDEALQVASKFPTTAIAVCEDRSTGTKRLVKEYDPDIIILDDAFQHRKVERDLDIVVIDANRLPIDDAVLPAGNLREFKHGLNRADILIFNKVSKEEEVALIRKKMWKYATDNKAFCRPVHKGIYKFSGELHIPIKDIAGTPAIVFSGIGNNEYFQKQLESIGIDIVAIKKYSDHYVYSKKDIEALAKLTWGQKPGTLLLTTEKDYHRMKDLFDFSNFLEKPFAYAPIGLEWLEGEQLVRELINPFLRASVP